jgi:hypothetical protein
VSLQAHAYVTLNPNFMEPEILMQYSQASGFVDTLAGGTMRTRLGEDDLIVYMKQMNLRTKMAAATATANELPGVDISATMLSAPTYMQRVRATYDHHDVAAGGRWGFSVVEAYRLGCRQGHYQLARDANLFGFNPQNGEGLINTPGALSTNLPADTNGNDTVLTYDNGQMAFYLAQIILGIKTRTNQLGLGRKFTILGPQRTLGVFQYNVVQLVQYQRVGAGTASTAGTLKSIVMDNGDELTWAYDDTLQGAAGSSDTDYVIVAMPEVEKPAGGEVNTNIFASLNPSNPVCITQYCDMAAPREIISPLAGGATDFLQEWRITSGWAPRYQALTLISMTYS